MTNSPQPSVEHGWTDEPVDATGDRLGRARLADLMAARIRTLHSWDSSVVFGLTGSWGSGKSSVIKMITATLQETVDRDPAWLIARFTPWSAGDTDELLHEFYTSLANELPEQSDARRKLVKLAATSSPILKAVPFLGSAAADIAKGLLDEALKPEPWQARFDAAAQALSQQRRPLLVVADDIDRLQRDELVTLLKVIRLLGRFPGVFYLLAYDEDTLHSTLSSPQASTTRLRARQFMEKIVQYQLPVPRLTPAECLDMLDLGLREALEAEGREILEEEYEQLSSVSEAFESQLATPRSIGRLGAHVRTQLAIVPPGEVNEIDLILTTFVRLQFPDLYAALPRWRSQLTGRGTMRALWNSFGDKETKPDWDDLLRASPSEGRDDAREVLEQLFPAMSGFSRERHRGIADPDYFDRYFTHGVPSDDVSDAHMQRAIENAAMPEGDADLRHLLTSSNRRRGDVALRKLHKLTTDPDDKIKVVTTELFRAVAKCLPQLDDTGMISPHNRAVAWLGSALHTLAVETAEPLDALLEETSLPVAHDIAWRSIRSAKRDDADKPEALQRIIDRLVRLSVEDFLDGLARRDEDTPNASYVSHLAFVRDQGDGSALGSGVQELIDTSDVTAEDVAARCVRIRTLIARTPVRSMHGGHLELLQMLIPEDDSFYTLPVNRGISPTDLGWSNRRAYSHGRFSRDYDPDDS